MAGIATTADVPIDQADAIVESRLETEVLR